MKPALSQVPPDAGSVRQQVERRTEPAAPRAPAPATVSDSAAPVVPSGATVTVAAFHFTGNTLLDELKLNSALESFLRRPLSFEELQKAVTAVADTYRRAGWIVRAYLPLQEIKDGTVTIAVVEAIFGETRLEGALPTRVPFERASSIVSARQKKGALVSATALDRALLLINDLPGVTATGHLAAGKIERETDLVLKVQDESLVSGEVIVDNAGATSTGEAREIATARLNSPFRIGDQFSATLLHAQGINYARLTGTTPIGLNGWRVGAHASHLKYELIAPEFAALDVQGKSTTFGLDTSFALLRSRSQSLNVSVAFDSSNFDNESNDIATTRYKVTTADVTLSGHRFDNFGAGGVSVAALTIAYGKADLTDSPNLALDAATTQVDGGFGKLNFFASRQQRFTERISLYAAVRGQFASGNLDSSEKLYLGGASGVRAYPSNEAGGDQGMLATLEGRVHLPGNFDVAALYDWGHITVNRNNDFLGAATLNSYNLQGVGASVGWTSNFGLNVSGTWARRLGDNPHPTVTGTDQDGTLKENRFWLQASMSF